MGIYDPPYQGLCTDPSAATCSVMATGLGSDGHNWFTGACDVYLLTEFPPGESLPDGGGGRRLFDGLFPAALANDPAEVDLNDLWIWVHVGRPSGEPISASFSISTRFFTPDGSTQIDTGAGWTASPSLPEFSHVLASHGSLVATTASPVRVRVYAGTGLGTYSVDWGAAIWSDQWCETPPPPNPIPARLATIVG